MAGSSSSGGCGRLTWMLSSAISTAWVRLLMGLWMGLGAGPWIGQLQRKGSQGRNHAAQTANLTKEKRNENQTDERVRSGPGEGAALLYRSARLCEEGRFQ